MRITIFAAGSRGDIQPGIMLGQALQAGKKLIGSESAHRELWLKFNIMVAADGALVNLSHGRHRDGLASKHE